MSLRSSWDRCSSRIRRVGLTQLMIPITHKDYTVYWLMIPTWAVTSLREVFTPERLALVYSQYRGD